MIPVPDEMILVEETTVAEDGTTNVQSFTLSAAAVATVIKEIIAAEPKLISIINQLTPFSAVIPAPWNVLNNPLVKEAVSALPKLLPILQQLANILDSLSPPSPPV